MKKIRFANQTEMEIYNITENGNSVVIEILNGDSNSVEQTFSDSENLTIIQYFVGTELTKGYSGYNRLQQYQKEMSQTISTDYNTLDNTTNSGFAEGKADILKVVLMKPEKIESVFRQTEQNTADIDYIAMETGVTV